MDLNRTLQAADPDVYQAVSGEQERLNSTLELIASENFVSRAVREAAGSVLTNKYAEGYPNKRYYGGCHYVDIAELLAQERANRLFHTVYANVQPHSGSQANMAAYLALINPGDKILGMNLAHGGHLTHGSPVNFSGKLFPVVSYGVRVEDGIVDYDEVQAIAEREKPRMIIAGFSAYPRQLDFAKFRSIADRVGAFLLTDMAHVAGLVAAGLYNDPLPHSHIVTTTTHKTLRGPRGGMILVHGNAANTNILDTWFYKERPLTQIIDSKVFPGTQGGPLMHIIAAKAVAFGEALEPEFKKYAAQIVENAQTLASTLMAYGYKVVTGGTDNHLLLLDLSPNGLTGKAAEEALEKAGITVNKNMVPGDRQKPFITSGIRIGTPALTTRGFRRKEIEIVGELIHMVLSEIENAAALAKARQKVRDLCEQFPLFEWSVLASH